MRSEMRRLSHTEWRSVLAVSQRKKRVDKTGRRRTRGTPVKGDLVVVAATVASGEVKRHVHVADEMDQKLERILDVAWFGVGRGVRPAESLELLQDVGGVPDRAQDVDVRPACPAL
jgi:hypothetical protein